MKQLYKDGAGNWRYGVVGEKLPDISYSTDSIPTGTTGLTADTTPIEWVETISDPTFWQVYRYCAKHNWAIVPVDSIDDKIPEISISIDWLMKHSEFGVIERWLKKQEKDNDTN